MLSWGALMAVCKASPCHPEFLWSLFVWHDAFLAVVSLRAIGEDIRGAQIEADTTPLSANIGRIVNLH